MGQTSDQPRLSQCPNCGATVTLPPEVVADRCVFCESPLVAAPEGASDHADQVAPFLLDRDGAATKLHGFLQGQWLAPKEVREADQPADLHGVLVPFWAHDADARSRWSANVGIYWYRTETYWVTVTRDGKSVREMRTRQVRETEWFPSSGTHAATYSEQLVSGSKGLPESEANALEPFDLGNALPYDPRLLAGWVAERPTLDRQHAEAVARQELAERENRAIAAFLPGDTHSKVRNQTDIDVSDVRLVLLPVWIATYRWQSEVHRLLVNGQTGEVVGTVPKAWGKVVLLVGVAVMALLFLAIVVLGLAGIAS
jgi:hypothetical protein